LQKLSSEEFNNFCGQCHRTWETVVRTGIRGAANVRFQPYRLENSKCFDGADQRLSCVSCHDPHQNVTKEAYVYDKVCLACHGSNVTRVSRLSQPPKHCPKESTRCVSCHMPRVEVNSPGGLLTFTDHQIRSTKPGEPYPN
jgi:nitrate reductase cytochrome c-type subunit